MIYIGRLIDVDEVSVKVYISGNSTDSIEKAIEETPTAFDVDMVLNQLEDYGKYKGILMLGEDSYENYIPVSMAKQIIRGRGLGGYLGYLEDK